MKGFVFRVAPAAADGQLLADRASCDGRDGRAAAAADERGARLRRPRRANALGPLFGRHRVALDNLRKAYPEKSEDEIRAIALDMWGNMARLAAEYIYLDQLFDYDPARPSEGRIEAFGAQLYEHVASEKKAAYHLHRPSRQFRADPGGRRGLWAARHGDVPPAQQSLHRQIHPLDPRAPRWAR